MKCPHCSTDGKHAVILTRKQEDDVLRRRLCDNCEKTFVTREYADAGLVIPHYRIKEQSDVYSGPRATSNNLFGVWK